MPKVIETAGRVVVGSDASPTAENAVDWAAYVADGRHKTLLILMVLDEHSASLRSKFLRSPVAMRPTRDAKARARALLAAAEARIRTDYPELTIETALASGHAADALVRATKDADLVVLGARGEAAPPGIRTLGGLSDAVVTHSEGALVAIVPENAVPHDGPVIVGVDDSPAALAAVRVAFRAAERDDRSLVALHGFLPTVSRSNYYNTPLDELVVQMAAEVDQFVAPVAAEHPSVKWEHRVVRKHPVWALVDASGGASMVVVGSRGRGGFAGLLLGSTCRETLRHAVSPVIVVHPPK